MKTVDRKKRIKEIEALMEVESRQSDLTRARSITVGNAFGGVTEVALRGTGDRFLWILVQPAEVVELINQLAANIGCHIHIQPRNDFASWRQWKETTEQPLISQHAPWPNHPPRAKIQHENQPGLDTPVRSNENVMATKKTVNRRNAKRTPKTA
jgi:hypothetical protein